RSVLAGLLQHRPILLTKLKGTGSCVVATRGPSARWTRVPPNEDAQFGAVAVKNFDYALDFIIGRALFEHRLEHLAVNLVHRAQHTLYPRRDALRPCNTRAGRTSRVLHPAQRGKRPHLLGCL